MKKKKKNTTNIEQPSFYSEFSPRSIYLAEKDLSSQPIPIIKKTEKLVSNFSYGTKFSFGSLNDQIFREVGSADSMFNNGDKNLEKNDTNDSLYGNSLQKYQQSGKDFIIDAKTNQPANNFNINMDLLENENKKNSKKKPFFFIPKINFNPENNKKNIKNNNKNPNFQKITNSNQQDYVFHPMEEEKREIHYREDDGEVFDSFEQGFTFNSTFESPRHFVNSPRQETAQPQNLSFTDYNNENKTNFDNDMMFEGLDF